MEVTIHSVRELYVCANIRTCHTYKICLCLYQQKRADLKVLFERILSLITRDLRSKEVLDSSNTWGFRDMRPIICDGEISKKSVQSIWKSVFSYSLIFLFSFWSTIYFSVSWTTYFISLSCELGLYFICANFYFRSTSVMNKSAFYISNNKEPNNPLSFVTFLC